MKMKMKELNVKVGVKLGTNWVVVMTVEFDKLKLKSNNKCAVCALALISITDRI